MSVASINRPDFSLRIKLRSPGLVPVLAALLVVLVGSWQIYRARQVAIAVAQAEVRNLSRSLAQHAKGSIAGIDLVLGGLIERIERGALADPIQFNEFLRRRVKDIEQVSDIAVLDEEGHWIASSLPEPLALKSADRAYFAWHRDQTKRGLHVDVPFISRVRDNRIIPLSRRWNKPDGSFGGVVRASLTPEHFQKLYSELGIGDHGVISLISLSGRTFARHPMLREALDRDLSNQPLFRKYLPASPKGVYWSLSPFNGSWRIAAYEKVDDLPLLVWVGRDADEVLATWYSGSATDAAVILLTALVLCIVGIRLGHHQRRASHAELQARLDSARHRRILDTATDAFVSIDADGAITAWSQAAEKTFGWPAAEVLGRTLGDVIVPDRYREAHKSGLLRYMATRQSPLMGKRNKLTGLRRDNTEFPIEVTMSADDADGRIAVNAFIQDISDREAREIELAESEARYRLLAETSTDMIVLADLDSLKRYVSPASMELLGYLPEELVNSRAGDMVHPDDAARLAGVIAGLSQGDSETASSTHRFKRKNGEYVWVETQCRLIRKTPSSPPSGYIALVRNVSVRHQQSEELRVAKEAAELATAAKTDFLASMSHEIRTPLNGVIGYADLLLDDKTLGKTHRLAVERIQTSGAALLTVVNDILDFSKIEAGKIELEPQSFSTAALIDNTVSIVRSSAVRKGLQLIVDVDAQLPDHVVGDQDRLRQVLLNFLNNAIKFTPRGSVTLQVHCEPREHGASALRFAVADTGIGIAKEKQHRLFERFSQIDGSIQRDFGGTGLGLAISKRLVELMGGRIAITSEEGRGSTFAFAVELMKADAVEAQADVTHSPIVNSGGARILLVEDIEINQELARAVLEKAGHRVDVVGDGTDAILAVQTKSYDLVLMDVQMPGMDGLTATRHIRELNHEARALPIIAMTANVLPHQIAAFGEAGMNDYIGKPFKRDALYAVVERWALHDSAITAVAEDLHVPLSNPVLDVEIYEGLQDLIGEQKVLDLLVRLACELQTRFVTVTDDQEQGQLAQDAHAMVSMAGMLGFSDLAEVCRELEEASATSQELSYQLARLQSARTEALDQITTLLVAA